MEKPSLWSRVGHWFRPPVRTQDSELASTGTSGGVEERSASARIDLIGGDGPAGSGRFRLARTTATVERLEEEYQRIVRLVESVQTHLERQGERTELMATSLSSLAESVASLPETSRTHAEVLSAIRQRMDADGASLKRLDENLSQLPRLADAQRETMVSIKGQLELSRQSNDKVGVTLDGVQEAVTGLGEATTATAKALGDLRSETHDREHRVASLLEKQTQRLTLLGTAAIVLALVAVVVAILRG